MQSKIWVSLVQTFSSVTQPCPTLWPHRLQHARLPCPSSTLGVYSNSCPWSQWCHSTISSSVISFSSHLRIIPSIRVFSNETILHIRWPKYWRFSFSVSPSSEYSGLISLVLTSFLLGFPLRFTEHGPCTSEQDPVPPTVSFSHQEASISFLSLLIRGQTE